MRRDPRLPLTETTFYILLALRQPAHGYAIMNRVAELSDGQVRLAAGTLYGALENLVKQKLIEPAASTDPRRKVYRLTTGGQQLLDLDAQRMAQLVAAHAETGREEISDDRSH